MLLGKMMTTSCSWELFVVIRGHTAGHIAPHPRITCVFSAQQVDLKAPGKSGGATVPRPHFRFSSEIVRFVLCKRRIGGHFLA